MSATRAVRALPFLALVTFLAWFGVTQDTDRFWITLGVEAMWVATAVVGLNVLLGYTGLISLGHYAFFVIGGFAGAIWAVQDWGLDPWLGFPVAFGVGAVTGALLALTCVHLRGFYLTVVTLAFGLISSSLALLFSSLFNGYSGRSVDEPLDTSFSFLDASNPNRPFVGLYIIGVGLLLLSLYVTQNLLRSRWGRAFRAIRESEIAARASGVSSYWYKVASFAISAGIVATAGVLAAQTNLQVTMPEGTVVVAQSFQYVVYLVVGGAGTLAGPVLGAFTFTLGFGVDIGGKSIAERLGGYETMFLAALVIVFMIVAPEGIVGALDRGLYELRRRIGRPSTPPQYRKLPDELVLPRPRHADDGPSGSPLLELTGVTVRFGGLAALSDVDLVVRRGEIHGLIGPNGSGKSTLVNVVSGIYRADRGRVRLRDAEVGGLAPHRITRLGVTRTFQNLQLWPGMTTLEHVMVGAHTRTRTGLASALLVPSILRAEERRVRRRAWGLLHFVGLSDRARDPAGVLPYADQRRLEIARALAADPDLLILDEPAAGMTPTEAQGLVELVRRVRDLGVTVLLIEHRMEVVMGLSDVVTVLDFGRRIAHGPPAAVRVDPQVVAAYLGEEAVVPPAPAVAVHEPAPASLADATPAEPLLRVRGLRVQYGAVRALDRVDLEVRDGEVVALIGSNGAGKSTTLKTVSGVAELLKTVQGEITFCGTRIERWPAHRIARLGLAHVPEGRRVFPDSSVEENLLLGGYGRREAEVRRDLDGIYERFPVLRQRRHQMAGLLSGGEQQMLAIGRGLASRPRCLLLDEPSLGLSPLIAEEVFSIVGGLAAEGVTVLVVEQMANRALAIADRAYVLETGHVVAEGPADALARDPHVRAAYLGEDASDGRGSPPDPLLR